MGSLNQEIQDILNLQKEVKNAEENARRSIERLRNEIIRKEEYLKERIKDVETTGDELKDFIICCYGVGKDELEATYRSLENSIQKHPGEFVLGIKRKIEPHPTWVHGHRDPQFSHPYDISESLFLGIIKDSSLIFDFAHSWCELPTSNYIRCWRIPQDPEYIEGNMGGYEFRLDFNWAVSRPSTGFSDGTLGIVSDSLPELQVKVGDVEVKAWFEKGDEEALFEHEKFHLATFRKMAHLLGRPLDSSLKVQNSTKEKVGTYLN